MQENKIAIFGGAFNPPTNAHLLLAEQIIQEFKDIKKIIFIPVSTKYNKHNLIQDKHRYNMLKKVCKKNKKFMVSNIELKSNRQLYTFETLQRIQEKYKKFNIYFILGTDNLKEFYLWKNPEYILENFKLIVLERQNYSFEEIVNQNELLKKYKESIIKLQNIEKINLSSTMVREKIGQGQLIEDLVPKEVNKYIEKNRLYL